ncbi:MAG: ROK family protein [Pirellulaceae bacterium]
MPEAAGSDSDQDRFIGVDVGGTTIKAGIADAVGRSVVSTEIPTLQHLGPADAIQRISAAIRKLIAPSEFGRIRAAGLGTPGPLDVSTGMILAPANLPAWRDFPIQRELSQALELPVAYANDANAAAFGEYWAGRGRQFHSLVLLTLGTGVGSGIIDRDRLIIGSHDHAAECGHLAVDFATDARMCSCGVPGHLEAYASASSVAARAREGIADAESGVLAQTLRSRGEVTARDVFEAATAGDVAALNIVDETADYLARGVADIAHAVDPQIFLLGGAMDFGGEESTVGSRFRDRIIELARQRVFPRIAEHLQVEFASLGGAAGWIGAAGLAQRIYDQGT